MQEVVLNYVLWLRWCRNFLQTWIDKDKFCVQDWGKKQYFVIFCLVHGFAHFNTGVTYTVWLFFNFAMSTHLKPVHANKELHVIYKIKILTELK